MLLADEIVVIWSNIEYGVDYLNGYRRFYPIFALARFLLEKEYAELSNFVLIRIAEDVATLLLFCVTQFMGRT